MVSKLDLNDFRAHRKILDPSILRSVATILTRHRQISSPKRLGAG